MPTQSSGKITSGLTFPARNKIVLGSPLSRSNPRERTRLSGLALRGRAGNPRLSRSRLSKTPPRRGAAFASRSPCRLRPLLVASVRLHLTHPRRRLRPPPPLPRVVLPAPRCLHDRGPSAATSLANHVLPHLWYRTICIGGDDRPVGFISMKPVVRDEKGDGAFTRASVGYRVA